jgi:maltokinase
LTVPRFDDLAGKLAPLLGAYLSRQRWYAGHEPPDDLRVLVFDLRGDDPVIAWLLVDTLDATGAVAATYQVVLGGRPLTADEAFLRGKERVTVGAVDGWVFYDALVDPELALHVLDRIAPDLQAEVARPLVVEQSNSSVVYDERLILKLFRRLQAETNPDVEITRALNERGFPHVVPQLAELALDGTDLAVVREYLLGSADAWQLAHTSLRDLLASPGAPEEAGGDFGPEAASLGDVTARLHLAMADIYGTAPGDPAEWLEGFRAQLARLPGVHGELRGETVAASDVVDVEAVDSALTGFVAVDHPGVATRIHGDFHLGQVLLGDTGWYILDFEGEPVRPVFERTRPMSPLRDVAGMFRSLHYAARTCLAERGRDVDPELVAANEAWEERAVSAFWRGYHAVPGIDALLPPPGDDRAGILRAFELDKAVYEVIYELSYRPDWVDIPASAIRRMLVRFAR